MSSQNNDSLSIANPHPKGMDAVQMIGLVIASLGVLTVLVAWATSPAKMNIFGASTGMALTISLLAMVVGTAIYSARAYLTVPEGIKNNGVWTGSLTARGAFGWIVGIVLTGFYVLIYWFPEYLGYQALDGQNVGLVALFDPLSELFKGKPATQWFVYGTLYTVIIIALGIKFMLKYRHNRYQLVRTSVVIASQLILAYLIPEILAGLNYNDAVSAAGEYQGWYDTDPKMMWPLDYDYFYGWHMDAMQAEAYQPIGIAYLIWGIVLFAVVTPVITYFVGKRWYCSWVCGCVGLAETPGDPFRQLSSKKMSSWKLERWLIHGIMVFVLIMTIATAYGYFTDSGTFLGLDIYGTFQKPYGFLIGAAFSGVIGVGFYPILGNRVWCRFGCPLAGNMGLIQRFKSKFRITTNGGQCISCGNCSTYCEQGIDVRHYAQRGQNIVRASCVGCGICAAVCPRGVLKLENGPDVDRVAEHPILVDHVGTVQDVNLMDRV